MISDLTVWKFIDVFNQNYFLNCFTLGWPTCILSWWGAWGIGVSTCLWSDSQGITSAGVKQEWPQGEVCFKDKFFIKDSASLLFFSSTLKSEKHKLYQ